MDLGPLELVIIGVVVVAIGTAIVRALQRRR